MNPGIRLGILGGGQLGAMLIRSAIDFGLRLSVLDKQADAACVPYVSRFQLGDPMNYEDVLAFGRTVDLLTIEMEAVNVEALRQLEGEGIPVLPSVDLIAMIQDKWTQKQTLKAAGIPVMPGILIQNKEELKAHAGELPACLKLCRHGYDGKGVMMLRKEEDIATAFDAPSVLEELADISKEISVIVARNAAGEVRCYDPVEMVFNPQLFLLDYQLCPSAISAAIAEEAISIAKRVAEAIKLVGIVAVEMFVTGEGKVIVNELAPRPHNSGHHTIEAAETSQYEQLLRAILGLPLGDTSTTAASVMINVLQPATGHQPYLQDALGQVLGVPRTHLHWYGKSGGKEGRKMGHITITADSIEAGLQTADQVRRLLQFNDEAVPSPS